MTKLNLEATSREQEIVKANLEENASENKRKEFYARFEAITEKYAALQHNKRSAFVAIIARSPADLITEGNALHHCVGRMNYDQRIVREESLIFFIRTRNAPIRLSSPWNTPLPSKLFCNATAAVTQSPTTAFCIMYTTSGFPTPTKH